MHFLPEQLVNLSEPSDRRGRVRRNPSSLAYLEIGTGNGGIVLNVSETGVAIAVAESIAETRIPCLSFRLPQLDRTFQTAGEIVWRSESKKSAGVRFVDLAETDRRQIRNWIREEIVSAEMQSPHEQERERPTVKPILIMPSPRNAGGPPAESDVAREEASATDFDRLFPSEATLKAPPLRAEPEVHSEMAQAANAANALLASEELRGEAPGPRVPPNELPAGAPETFKSQVDEPATSEPPVEMDWRDEWERFHLERENVARVRQMEPAPDLPLTALIPSPVPESVPASDAVRNPGASGKSSIVESTSDRAMIPAAEAQNPGPAEAATGVAATNADSLPPRMSPQLSRRHERAVESPAAKMARQPPRARNSLSVATLSIVLLLLCFALGYAIQPGALHFSAAKSGDAQPEAAQPDASGQTAPDSTADSPGTSGSNAASDVPPAGSAPQIERESAGGPSGPAKAADSASARRPENPVPVAPEKSANPGPTNQAASPVNSGPAAQGRIAGQIPAPNVTVPSSTAAAPIPVSFFPVTAPEGGSPARLVQLPEETISDTAAVLIRSREFLFVPAAPGPQSTHELERVHVGDRVVKVNPSYPPQGAEKIQAGTVHLRSTIGTDGTISDVQPISGPTNLLGVAANAVRQWRYKPSDIDGKPIAVEEDITVEFRAVR